MSTEPITENTPLIAQPQATYSSACGLSTPTVRSPNGMNMPRHSPSGASTTNASTDPHRKGAVEGRFGQRRQARTGRTSVSTRQRTEQHRQRPSWVRRRTGSTSSAPNPVKTRIEASVTVSE